MDHEEERDIIAMAMILLAEGHEVTFSRDHVALESPTALMSSQLVSDLMRLAAFYSNLNAAFSPPPGTRKSLMPGEDVFMAMAFDYAIESAPRKLHPSGKMHIDLKDLASHVRMLRGCQGPIDIDHDMVARVTRSAVQRITAGPQPEPEAMGA